MYTPHPGPQRCLPAELADAVRQAKIDSGLTYRQLAARIGVSHPHLVRIAGGVRVPSRRVAVRLIEELWIDSRIADELLELAYEPELVAEMAPDHRLRGEPMDTRGGSPLDRPYPDQTDAGRWDG